MYVWTWARTQSDLRLEAQMRWFRRRREIPQTGADVFTPDELRRLQAPMALMALGSLGVSARQAARSMTRLHRELNREAIDRAAIEAEHRRD